MPAQPSTPTPVSDLSQLLRTMAPIAHEGVYVFCRLPDTAALKALLNDTEPLATFREAEGLTVVVEESSAQRHALPVLMRTTWITLQVHSALDAVGFTAIIAKALGDAGISCNVIAAACHDHLFVPVARSADALAILQNLQRTAATSTA